MEIWIGATIVAAATCIRCAEEFFSIEDQGRIALNRTTRSPLRPDGTLTGPDDPDFFIARVCPKCDAITMILADEIGLHKEDLITYFKVIFPHGRYDLVSTAPAQQRTESDPEQDATPAPDHTQRDPEEDHEEPQLPEPIPATLRHPRETPTHDAPDPASPDHKCVYDNGRCILC